MFGGGLFGQPSQQQQPAAAGGGLFGQPSQQQQGGGLFGQPSQQQQGGGGLFGQQQQQPQGGGGLFGQQQQQQPQGGGLFGQQQQPATGGTSLFGQQQQPQQQTGGLFGQQQQPQQQAGGLFGQQQQPQQQAGGLFGQQQQPQQQAGGLFGQQQQTQQQTGGLFGQQPQTGGLFGQQQPQQQTGGLFGQQQPQQPQQTGGLFGQQQTGGLFGQQTGGLFGQQPQQGGGLFGQQQQPQQQAGGLFGQQPQQQALPIPIPAYEHCGFPLAWQLLALNLSSEHSVYLQFSKLPAKQGTTATAAAAVAATPQEYIQNNFIPLQVQDELLATQTEIDAQAELLATSEEDGRIVAEQIAALALRVKSAQRTMQQLVAGEEAQRANLHDLMLRVKEDHRVLRNAQTRKPASLPSAFFQGLLLALDERVRRLDARCGEIKQVISMRSSISKPRATVEQEQLADCVYKQHQLLKLHSARVSAFHAKLRAFKSEHNITLPELDLEDKLERERQQRLLKKIEQNGTGASLALVPQQQQPAQVFAQQQQQPQQQQPQTPFSPFPQAPVSAVAVGGNVGMMSPFGGPDLMASPDPNALGGLGNNTGAAARRKRRG